MAEQDRHSPWASGAPKWAAVIVLGSAAVAGVAWSMGRDGQVWRSAQAAAIQPPPGDAAASPPIPPTSVSPAPVAAASAPADVKHRPPAGAVLHKRININTAGQGELELLPGIGPALAKRIIDYRTSKGPFKRIDDLDAVKGIGPKTMARLRELITVE